MICEGLLTLCLSQGALIGSTIVDLASTRGQIELNPILGRGEFGSKQVAISSGLTVGIIVLEHVAVRKWPKSKKLFTVINIGVSGAHVGAAIRNH